MMLLIHRQVRATQAVHLEIVSFHELTDVLAKRFAVSTVTIPRWRKRGVDDCQDRRSRPHKLPWKATARLMSLWARPTKHLGMLKPK